MNKILKTNIVYKHCERFTLHNNRKWSFSKLSCSKSYRKITLFTRNRSFIPVKMTNTLHLKKDDHEQKESFSHDIIVKKHVCGRHVKKICKDVFVDGVCIVGNSVLNCLNICTIMILFTSCVLNNICLNVCMNTSKSFIHRGFNLFKMGLITNTIIAFIYLRPFNLIFNLKYVLCMSLGMGILSNLRYGVIFFIEDELNMSVSQLLILRTLNNFIGTIQQSSILYCVYL